MSHKPGWIFSVRYALSDIRHRRSSALLNLLAVSIGCSYVLGLGMYGHGLYEMQRRFTQDINPARIIASAPPTDQSRRWTPERLSEVAGWPGIQSASPYLELSVRLFSGVSSILLPAESVAGKDPAFSLSHLKWGRACQSGANEIVLGEETFIGVLNGSIANGQIDPQRLILQISWHDAQGNEHVRRESVQVVGLLHGTADGRAYLPLPLISELDRACSGERGNELPATYLRACIYAASAEDVESVVHRLRRSGYETEDHLGELKQLRDLGRSIAMVATVFVLGVIVNAALSIFITTLMNIKTRMHEIGILRTFGLNLFQILRIFIVQGVLLGVLATLIALAVIGWIEPLIRPWILQLLGVAPQYFPQEGLLDLWWLAVVAASVATLFGLGGLVVPTTWACSLKPIDALRRRDS